MRTLASESLTISLKPCGLPQAVRTVVSVLDIPLYQLAAAADKVNETIPKAAVLCANIDRRKRAADRNHLRDLEMEEIRRQWREFSSQMMQIAKTLARTSLRQTRARSKSRQRRRSKSPAVSSLCWYHQTFGDRLTKCKPPCNY